MPAKDLLYATAKAGGLFPWARQQARDSLCILCYHGFSFTDEHLFRPKLFLTPALFRQRMEYLKGAGYTALPLDEALSRLRQGKLGEKELVITIDDGFHSVAALAAPILKEVGFTATIYVTTYYVEHNNPIFRLALQYIFWRSALDEFDATGLPVAAEGLLPNRGAAGETVLWRLIDYGETVLDEAGRQDLARDLGRRLGVSYDELVASRRLSLLSKAEVTDLARQGFDIQLHTHRHRLPLDRAAARRELQENRAVLAPLAPGQLNHLCYPSGVWSQDMWPVLAAEGVATATTCEPGRNYPTTPALGLKRFLDFQTISPIVFEAEVSGFSEMLRRLRGRLSLG
ncbi:MAG TPA: polysaccharide deacetylase family protein [Rhodocyclaceae bacterium]|nr:polysaccharide deacetylase family protein [Rhodocyclaceae bacterium]